MSGVVDLSAERDRREGPDPGLVRQGEDGPLYLFTADFRRTDDRRPEGRRPSIRFWARDFEEAQAIIDAMRESLELAGQVHAEVLL